MQQRPSYGLLVESYPREKIEPFLFAVKKTTPPIGRMRGVLLVPGESHEVRERCAVQVTGLAFAVLVTVADKHPVSHRDKLGQSAQNTQRNFNLFPRFALAVEEFYFPLRCEELL